MDPQHDSGEDRAATGAAAWRDPNFAAVFEHAGIRPEARAEDLDVVAWGRLAACNAPSPS